MSMRSYVLAFGLLVLAAAAVAVTSDVAHGQQDSEKIHVYKSPT